SAGEPRRIRLRVRRSLPHRVASNGASLLADSVCRWWVLSSPRTSTRTLASRSGETAREASRSALFSRWYAVSPRLDRKSRSADRARLSCLRSSWARASEIEDVPSIQRSAPFPDASSVVAASALYVDVVSLPRGSETPPHGSPLSRRLRHRCSGV